MKKKWISFMVAVSLLGVLAGCSSGNETVASYKGGKITQEDLYEELKTAYGSSVLETLVINKVLEKDYGSKVTDDDIEEEYQKWVTDYGDESTLESLLTSSGYTKETFKESYLKGTMLYKVAVEENLEITNAMYKEAWTNSLDFSIITTSTEDAAKEIITKLKAGEDFATLAKSSSTDATNTEGGAVGWYNTSTSSTYDSTVIDAAKKLKDGEITETPINVDGVYYIVKMVVNPSTTSDTWKDYKTELKEQILTQYQGDSTYMTELLSKLLKAANVKVTDDDLQSALSTYLGSTTTSSSGTTSSSSK